MTKTCTTSALKLATSLAPEDVRCGDDVAVLNEIVEFPSFLWDESIATAPEKVVRVWERPTEGGMPLRVKAVCLPFLFVKTACGEPQTLDLRQVQLVRLSRDYAKAVRKQWKRKPVPKGNA